MALIRVRLHCEGFSTATYMSLSKFGTLTVSMLPGRANRNPVVVISLNQTSRQNKILSCQPSGLLSKDGATTGPSISGGYEFRSSGFRIGGLLLRFYARLDVNKWFPGFLGAFRAV